MTAQPWTENEIAILKEYYPTKGAPYCSKLINRTVAAIKTKVRKLGLNVTKERRTQSINRNRNKRSNMWSDEEVNWLIKNYPNFGVEKCAIHLGKSIFSIKSKASKLGLRITEETLAEIIKTTTLPNQYSLEDEEFLSRNYPHKGAKWCANQLDRPIKSVEYKVHELGLKADPESLSNRRSEIVSELISEGKCLSKNPRGISGTYFSTKLNKEIKYRSGWEKQYYEYLDNNEDVVSYEPEPFSIPYKDGKTSRHYVPDILVTYSNKKRDLIEIKPERWVETEEVKNKIKAGRLFAKQNSMNYIVLTENDFPFAS